MLDQRRLRERLRLGRQRRQVTVRGLNRVREDLVAVRCMLLEMQTFDLGGETYSYIARDRGNTWWHERAVELPIAQRAVADAGNGAVLEVGNVLRQYFPELGHRVVDKYEHADGVENIDVMDVEGSYDLIVSISTLEHVGFDEHHAGGVAAAGAGPREAIARLRGCLAPGGRLLFTSPVGYNPALDEALNAGIPGVEARFLRRVDIANRWVEADWRSVSGVKYGKPYRNANAIVVGTGRP